MLRLIVLLLLLGNGAFYAWSQGLLAAWGIAPAQQSEPQRLAQQVRPEALRFLTSEEARRVDVTAVARPTECLQAGPLDEAQVVALRAGLQSWPAATWAIEPTVEAARWIVYMGKYPSTEAVSKKKGELRQLGVSFQSLVNPALEPGLSLGGFRTEGEADQHLSTLTERGVRTARVIVERPEVRGQALKLASVDEGLRPRLDELRPLLGGKPLRACR